MEFAVIADVVSVGIADGFPGGAFVDDVTCDLLNAFDGIFATEHEEEGALAIAVFIGGEVFEDVVTDLFLGDSVAGVGFGDDAFGVFLDEFFAGGEHHPGGEFESGAGEDAGNDASGAGFADGVWGE